HLLLHGDPLTALELDDVLHGDDALEDAVLHVHGGDPALEVGLHLVLVAGVGVHDVPRAGTVVGALDRSLLLVVVGQALVEDDHVGRGRVFEGRGHSQDVDVGRTVGGRVVAQPLAGVAQGRRGQDVGDEVVGVSHRS